MSTRRLRWLATGAILSAIMVGCGTEPAETSAPPAPSPLEAAMALGEATFTAQCIVCHTVVGDPGVGPRLDAEMLETFSSCSDEIRFTTIGSGDWPEDTYGDLAKPIGGSGTLMPGFESVLSADEIRAVTLWSRVTLGGAELERMAEDCGVAGAG